MRIYILRHGISEERRASKADAGRKLTGEGKQKLIAVLERARLAKVSPSLILSSPLARALESAEIAARMLHFDAKIEQTDALLPDSTPEGLWQEIRARAAEPELLLAGHEPHLSASIAYLLGTPSLQIDLKKGALVRIDIDNPAGEPKGVLKWMLTPALA
jgi:phosphohistidine phosphatase